MLNLIEVSSASDRLPILQEFNSTNSTWVVSDLAHKRELQNFYLTRDGHLQEDACLRVREFWQKLLQRSGSKLNVISADLVKVFLSDWLKAQNISWARGGTSTETLYSYLELFAPILIDEERCELTRNWLAESPMSLMKWGAWFELSERGWRHLSALGIATSAWCAALVQKELEFKDAALWEGHLYVDVGAELAPVEAELLKLLAQKVEVTVLIPAAETRKRFAKTLWPYQLLSGDATVSLQDEVAKNCSKIVSCIQSPTRLSEVKTAVAKVRSWLESGVAPSDIALYARDPETYWPSLSSHFSFEGIPVAKDVVASLSSFPSLGHWLSGMKSHLDKTSSEDIEGWLFSSGQNAPTDYSRFRSLLSHVYEEGDLGLLPELRRQTKALPKDKSLFRDEFVLWSLGFFSEAYEISALEPVISRLVTECPSGQKLPVSDWIRLVESVLAKGEVILQKGIAEGLQFKKLESSIWETRPYRIVLGLSQSDLADISRLAISPSEVQKLANDLGFFLQSTETSRFEFLLTMNLEAPAKELFISYPVHDFSGEALSPAVIWSVNELQFGKVDFSPRPEEMGRWDQAQTYPVEKMGLWVEEEGLRSAPFVRRLLMDKGEAESELAPLPVKPTLSASQLKSYVDCGFKFFAAKGLRLKSEPELILDIDRLRRGRLLHKVFELILKKGLSQRWDSEALAELIEEAVSIEQLPLFQTLWPFQKKRLVQIAQRFVDFEKTWQKKFPTAKTIATEVDFEGELFGRVFRGKIDRVDQCSDGSYLVVDYKSSTYSVSHHGKWVSEGEFQLFLYCHALENGWTELDSEKCVGAVYYDLKDFSRNTGFLRKDLSEPPYEVSARSGAAITEDDLKILKEQCLEQIQALCEKIEQGHFEPSPKDAETVCPNCEWKVLCRATHLNI